MVFQTARDFRLLRCIGSKVLQAFTLVRTKGLRGRAARSPPGLFYLWSGVPARSETVLEWTRFKPASLPKQRQPNTVEQKASGPSTGGA